MLDLSSKFDCSPLLMGDFNAYTGTVQDFVDIDVDFENNVFDMLNNNIETSNNDIDLCPSASLRKANIVINRKSDDLHNTNNSGNSLIDICRSNNLYRPIFNGRLEENGNGHITNIKGKTVVDYVIGSFDIMKIVSQFYVCNFDPSISDIHCGLFTKVNTKINTDGLTDDENQCAENKDSAAFNIKKKICFCKENGVQLNDAISDNDINNLENLINENVDTNSLYNAMKDCILNACDKCNMLKDTKIPSDTRNCKSKKYFSKSKPWFCNDCKTARKNYHRRRNFYLNHKNDENFLEMKNAYTSYKSTLRKAERRYRKKFIKDLRKMKSTNPKTYWSVINPKARKQMPTIELNKLKEHFENLSKNCIDEVTNQNKERELNDLLNSFIESEDAKNILNKEFTEIELSQVIKKLKNNKSPGIDQITNETICYTYDKLKSFWCKLFNKILLSGEVPKDWLTGVIIPIYKNKGDKNDPNNYRGITLLSCGAKFFTSILNHRLLKFSETVNLLSENQAGFRPNHSTIDHIFVIKSFCDIIRNRKKKLYCAFVDYEKAFDKVWHLGLWQKLLNSGIGGNLLNVLRSMYSNLVSCVSSNNINSDMFSILQGVRQGENLSPFLFALYINDLEKFMTEKGCRPVDLNLSYDDRISEYLKLLIILYADDTAIFAENERDLQKSLDVLQEYCDTWKVKVNSSKTKIMIFSGKKYVNRTNFLFYGENLEVVTQFKYLGLVFNFNGKFNIGVKQLRDQARRAMMSLLNKSRQLKLPISIQIELFHVLVRPILTYSSEVWGYANLELVESLHREYLKYILNLKKSTANIFVYGETGEYPIYIHIYCRMLKFWHSLSCRNPEKYSSRMLKTLNECYNLDIYKNDWLSKIREILNSIGLTFVWNNPGGVTSNWLIRAATLKLKDQFLQKWQDDCNNSSKATNYNLYKNGIEFEKYLDDLPFCYRNALIKLRTSNTKLPIEKGRYQNLPFDERLCTLCDMQRIGDDFHFLLECPHFSNNRKAMLPKFCTQHPNFYKYSYIMSSQNKTTTLKLSKNIYKGFLEIK